MGTEGPVKLVRLVRNSSLARHPCVYRLNTSAGCQPVDDAEQDTHTHTEPGKYDVGVSFGRDPRNGWILLGRSFKANENRVASIDTAMSQDREPSGLC